MDNVSANYSFFISSVDGANSCDFFLAGLSSVGSGSDVVETPSPVFFLPPLENSKFSVKRNVLSKGFLNDVVGTK
jgi:hypothetical protein